MKKILIIILFLNILFGKDLYVLDLNNTKKRVNAVIENPFSFKPKELSQNLSYRIKINKKNGYTLTALKFDIEQHNIENINSFERRLGIVSEDLKEYMPISKIIEDIKKVKINNFSKKYTEELSQENNSTLKKEVLKKLSLYKHNIESIEKSTEYLVGSLKIKEKETEFSIFNVLKFSNLINIINKKYANVNYELHKYHIDIGRLYVFVIIFVLFLLIAFLLNKFFFTYLYKRLRESVAKEAEDTKSFYDDSEELSIKPLKRIFFFLMGVVGLRTAIETIIYPTILNDKVYMIFSIVELFLTAFVLNYVIDYLIQIYIHKFSKIQRYEIVNTIIRIIKYLMYLIAFLISLTILGVDPAKLLTSLGIGSLAVAFGSKDLISNFFAGLKLIFDPSFSPGDWVYIKNEKDGVILDITFTRTKLRTFDNSVLVIPNSLIVNRTYENWSRRKIGRKINLDLLLPLGIELSRLTKAKEEIIEFLINHKDISPTKANFDLKKFKDGKFVAIGDDIGLKNTLLVNITEANENGINLNIYTFSKSVLWKDWRETKENVIKNVINILRKNDIKPIYKTINTYLK